MRADGSDADGSDGFPAQNTDAARCLVPEVRRVLQMVRTMWWAPTQIAKHYEVWGLWCTDGGVGRLARRMEAGLVVPPQHGVTDMWSGKPLWGPVVDQICPPGVTAVQMAENACEGFVWPLDVCSQLWRDHDTGRRTVSAGELESFGNVVDRGQSFTVWEGAGDVGGGWSDMLVAWMGENVPGLWMDLGEQLGMCHEWFSHTERIAADLSRL